MNADMTLMLESIIQNKIGITISVNMSVKSPSICAYESNKDFEIKE